MYKAIFKILSSLNRSRFGWGEDYTIIIQCQILWMLFTNSMYSFYCYFSNTVTNGKAIISLILIIQIITVFINLRLFYLKEDNWIKKYSRQKLNNYELLLGFTTIILIFGLFALGIYFAPTPVYAGK